MNAQTKHTPGPWGYGFRLRRYGAAGTKQDTILAIDAPNNINVGCVSGFVGSNANTAIANARLIAAAPELLESLLDLVAMADFVAQREPGMDELKARIADARAAIANAVTP